VRTWVNVVLNRIHTIMSFSRNERLIFTTSVFLILTGYILMSIDRAENGFGLLTLWIAPPMLLVGFFAPIVALVGIADMKVTTAKLLTMQYAGGFAVLVISFVTYAMTVEPTASLWDCSEFIASAYKLQVPHTPGTPLSLLIGRIFTQFAGTNVKQVALTLNIMSALFSALSVCLLYHVIYFFASRMQISGNRSFVFIVAALCGSLTLTFSDTFWFSAVEAETYGLACFFLLLLIVLILKGSTYAEPRRSRWLVLIFYLGGLSYCIHPMCVLALPLLPFTWYTKDRLLTTTNIVVTVTSGLLMVFAINRIIGIGTFEAAFTFDLYFVNSLKLPFYTGAVAFVVFAGAVALLVFRRYPWTQRYVWCLLFLVLGFLPYVMLFIRSNHNPPIDETNPENLALIKAYMNRESYGSTPLLYGPYYDAQIEEFTVKKKIYHKAADRYEYSGIMPGYQYESARSTVLPRMYSNDADHVEAYQAWTGLGKNEKPGFRDNLYFMFTYQLGHMYLRYLMFNFAGRESDHQNADWLRPWSVSEMQGDPHPNKANNQYWMLPLILGIGGMVWQLRKDPKGVIMIALFFLITGIVLAIYLNSPPIEPRERDYIYIGSFIAFCIWVGLGIVPLYQITKNSNVGKALAILTCVSIPTLLLWQNLDDHDRSGRTFQIDNARNLLNSCAPNSILFTGGDNDTFPLWYLQEVEAFRTDVRVMVLSYMNTDWYIDQLRRPYYKSQAFAFTLDKKDYVQYGPNDVLYVQNKIKQGIDIEKFLTLLKAENSALRATTSTGDVYTVLPSDLLKLKVTTDIVQGENTMAVKANNSLDSSQTLNEISFTLSTNYLQKNALAILDLLASNGWKRSIYFNFTSLNTAGLDLNNHVIQEGNIYRLMPLTNDSNDIAVNKELMWKNLTEGADYSNLANEKVYFNFEDYHSRMIAPARQSFNTLAIAYLREGNAAMAEKVIAYAVDKLYLKHLLPSYSNLQTADILIALEQKDKAAALCTSLFDFHFVQLKKDRSMNNNISRLDLFLAQGAADMLSRIGNEEALQKLDAMGLAKPN